MGTGIKTGDFMNVEIVNSDQTVYIYTDCKSMCSVIRSFVMYRAKKRPSDIRGQLSLGADLS